MRAKILGISVVFLLALSLFSAHATALTGWNESYDINITNPSAGTVLKTYHTVNFTFDTATEISAGRMMANCTDVKITYNNGGTNVFLDRIFFNETWMADTGKARDQTTGCNKAGSVIMFATQANISASGSDTANYKLVFGNSSDAAPLQNHSKVFLIYDDFNRANNVDLTGPYGTWDEVTANVEIVSNMLQAYTTGNNVVNMRTSRGSITDVNEYEVRFTSMQNNPGDPNTIRALPTRAYPVTQAGLNDGSQWTYSFGISESADTIIEEIRPPYTTKHSISTSDVTGQYVETRYIKVADGALVGYKNASVQQTPTTELAWTTNTSDNSDLDEPFFGFALWWGRPNGYVDEVVMQRWIDKSPITTVAVTPTTPSPQWSNNKTSVASGTEWRAGRNYGFQITFDGSPNRVNLTSTFNGASTIYTVATTPSLQNSSGIFWINFTTEQFNGSATYSFNWAASNSSGTNTTPSWNYVINKNTTTIYLAINGTQANKTYITNSQTNVTAWKLLSIGENISLYRNGTLSVGSTSNSVSEIATRATGTYNYTTILDHQNYTATAVTRWLSITTGVSSYTQTWEPEEWETGSNSFNLTLNFDVENIDNINASIWWNNTEYLPYYKTNTSNQYIFRTSFVVPFFQQLNNSYTPFWNYTVFAIGANTSYTTTNMSQTVYSMQLTNCAGNSTTSALIFRSYEEKNRTNLNTTKSVAFTIWKDNSTLTKTYSYNFTLNTTSHVCIYPYNATYVANALIENSHTGYNTRFYNLYHSNLTNSSANIDLFLLGTTIGSNVLVTVKDSNGVAQIGAIIKVLRWYTELNSYNTVTAPMTSNNGDTSVDLELNDAYYKFIIEKNGIVLDTISKQIVTGTELTLLINPTVPTEYFRYYNQIAHSCNYNTVTQFLSCTGTDTSGYVNGYTLVVKRIYALGTSSICSTSSTTSAATITCNLGNASGNIFHYVFSATFSSGTQTTLVLVSDYIEEDAVSLMFGNCADSANQELCKEGLFATFFITAILAVLMAPVSVVVSLMVVLVGSGFGVIMGLITLKWGTIVGLMLAAGIIMYKGMR